jgi:hypothetical protein
VGQTSSGTSDFFGSWGLGVRLYLCRPSALGGPQVTSGAPDGTTCVVGRSGSGSDGPVLFLDNLVASGNTCDPFGGLCITPDGPT